MRPQTDDDRTVFIYEGSPKWVPELQRQFRSESGVQVRTLTRLANSVASVLSAKNPVVLLQLDASPADCLRLLTNLSNRARLAPVIVVGSDRMADLEWPVRELGAVDFRAGFVPGSEIAAFCRTQWRQTASTSDT